MAIHFRIMMIIARIKQTFQTQNLFRSISIMYYVKQHYNFKLLSG